MTTVAGDFGTGKAPSLPTEPAPKKEAPILEYGPPLPKTMLKVPTTSAEQAAATESVTSSWFMRNVPVVNLPVWQVALGSVGLLAIGAGLVSLFSSGSRHPATKALRGYR